MASKRLFTSPVKSTTPLKKWNSPSVRSPRINQSSSSTSPCIIGYIIQIGITRKSGKGNSMFDVLMKDGAESFKTVRVMEARQSRAKVELQKVRNSAVKMTVSTTQDGTIFFNEDRGGLVNELTYPLDFDNSTVITDLGSNYPRGTIQFIRGSFKWVEDERLVTYNNRVRKCLIKDSTGESLLSFWNHSIDEVKEGKWYLISYVDQTQFHGDELSCSKISLFEECKSGGALTWDNIEQFLVKKGSSSKEITRLCCPDIISVKIQASLHCPVCEAPRPAGKLIRCEGCNEKSAEKHALKKLQGTLRLQTEDLKMTLIFDEELIHNKYPGFDEKKEGVTTDEKLGEIEDDIALLENVDLLYDDTKMQLKDIIVHEQNKDPIGEERESDNEEHDVLVNDQEKDALTEDRNSDNKENVPLD